MTDTTAVKRPDSGSCATSSGCPPWVSRRWPASPPSATATPWRPSWRCWSRRPRTAGSGALAGCAPRLGYRRARPGRPSSTTGYPWRSGKQLGRTGPTEASWNVGVNVLAFGLPGTGKTHALCAVGHRLVESGHSVLFAPAYRLVQDLLAAKRDLALPRQLRKTLQLRLPAAGRLGIPAPRGPRSPRCSSPSSPNATSAGPWASPPTWSSPSGSTSSPTPWPRQRPIDRVVHHSVILEFDVPSYRTGVAQQRGQDKEVNRQE